jgi:hypothetical protein
MMALAAIVLLLAALSFAGEDGINIDRCEDVVIEDCFVTSNDDPMCIKSGPDEAFAEGYRFDCRNITTSGCVIFNNSYRALQIGAEASANFEEDILYRNIYIVKAGSGINIGLTYSYPDKALVRNVRYENIYMERGATIALYTTYMDSGATLDGVYLKNILAYGGCPVSLKGKANYPVSNITFENLFINGTLVQNSTNFTIGTNVNNVRVLVSDDRTGYPVALRLVNPTDNAMVLKNVPLKLQAHCYQGPQTTLQRCEFFVNGTSVGSATKAPWEVSWTPTVEGSATISATLTATGSKPVSTLSPVKVSVVGSSVLGGVALNPPALWLKPAATQQFSARVVDKKGIPLPLETAVQWSGKYVNAAGLYTAPSTGTSLDDSVVATLVVGGTSYRAVARVQVSSESVQGVILNTKSLGITTTLTDFPLLVRLSAENFPFNDAGARPRLRFTDVNGAQLAHQIERWDGAAKQASVWVRMPQISPQTTFYTVLLHWNQGSDGADYDSVFSGASGFEAVWHLSNTADALGRHNLSASKSSFIDNPLSGSAIQMDTTFGTSFAAPINWLATQPFTVSGWMRTASLKTTLVEGTSTVLQFSTPGGVGYSFIVKGDVSYYAYCKNQALLSTPGGAWNHIAVTRQADGTMFYYFNGVAAQLESATAAKAFKFDKLASASQGSAYDEIRIERVARSSDWIRLCYETQKPAAAQDVLYDGNPKEPPTHIASPLHSAAPAIRELVQPIAGGILINPRNILFDNTHITLYTLQGRLVYASEGAKNTTTRVAAAPGLYLVRYKTPLHGGAATFQVW